MISDVTGWRKSSYSGGQGGNCAGVGRSADGSMLVRDTKDRGHGPVRRCRRFLVLGLEPGTYVRAGAQ